MGDVILDPTIPFMGPICGQKFSPGKILRIEGAIPPNAYRFSIALQCGPETVPRDDAALHITVRLLDGCVSLNSLQDGMWDDQQRGSVFSVKRGEKFEIAITCDHSHYMIAINDEQYCKFPQRIPYDYITHLAIEGDVLVDQISCESSEFSEALQTSVDNSLLPEENVLDIVKLIDTAPLPGLNPTNTDPSQSAYDITADNKTKPIQEFTIAEAVPLNPNGNNIPANPSKYEALDRYYWPKWCALFWGVIVCIIIIFAIVISQADERPILVKLFNSTNNDTDVGNNTLSTGNNDTFISSNENLISEDDKL